MPRARRLPIPVETQVEVLFRDAWLCHLCRRPVILHLALKHLQTMVQEAMPGHPTAYWQRQWRRDAAPLLDELAASIDHVKPFSRGGAHDASNFAAVCARCNARKSAADDEVYLSAAQPWLVKGKYGEPTAWDGLASAFVVLAERADARLTPTELRWLKAIRRYLPARGAGR